jgi:hypothetical protein|tara:strand:+ start:14339 stop:15244 length:906 start_codon:yes stop_codon:yes gene_type:complete
MTKGKDGLGITLTDTGTMLADPPCCVLYARPGFGKTTQLAQCFSDALWLVTNKGTLRPYAHWCMQNREEVEKLELRTLQKPNPKWKPKQKSGTLAYLPEMRAWEDGGMAMKVIPEYMPDNKTRVDNRTLIKEIVYRFSSARQEGTCPYNGLVFDEGTEFARRFHAEMEEDPAIKGGFAVWSNLEDYLRWLFQVPRGADCFMGFLCHERAPKYDDREGSPTAGQLQYVGGPSLPSGSIRGALSGICDILLRGVVKPGFDGPKRIWQTQISKDWDSKIRSFNVDPEEQTNLRDLLIKAGYRLS